MCCCVCVGRVGRYKVNNCESLPEVVPWFLTCAKERPKRFVGSIKIYPLAMPCDGLLAMNFWPLLAACCLRLCICDCSPAHNVCCCQQFRKIRSRCSPSFEASVRLNFEPHADSKQFGSYQSSNAAVCVSCVSLRPRVLALRLPPLDLAFCSFAPSTWFSVPS